MGGAGSVDLAIAVTQAGAFGMIPGGHPPDVLDRLRDQTNGMFGVNFLMPFVDREAVAIAADMAKLVEFFYGQPDPTLVELVHEGRALASWQVGSRHEALDAVAAGCDLIVAQGREAGGHVRGTLGLLTVLSQVLEAFTIPVLAAGGIGTARAMAAALAAGAAGVRVGTRFVAAEESAAHPAYVEALIAATAEDTTVTEAFSTDWPDAPHRVLRSSIEAATANQMEPVGYAKDGWAIPRLHSAPPQRGTTGHIEAMALYAGESVDGVTRVQPAAQIVRELAEGAEQLLRRFC
jgi:NAD(P)H-dependent flavin oxidoreductase YrpB (nitropropane dioxygenase family)